MNAMVLKRMALKSKDKKGFTLVEVIVVLVILAILMAIAVPALTGYIDKAKNDALLAEAAGAKTAVQTIVSSAYASSGEDGFYTLKDGSKLKFTKKAWATAPSGLNAEGTADKDVTLATAASELTSGSYEAITDVTVETGTATINGLKVELSDDKTAVFANGEWSLIDTPEST
jgi:prepilin-type N-terminal cleavage/methylation domain-containing protein